MSLPALLLLLLGLGASPPPGTAAEPAPRIAVEPADFDFGAVLPRKTLRKEFQLRNFGDAELRIEGVSTSCGCTAALPASRIVAPGASIALRVSVDTRDDRGRVRRSILIRSNDPQTPVLELRVRAEVRPAGEASGPR